MATFSQHKVDPLQSAIWNGSLPIEIRLSPSECRIYDKADPYLIQYPRLSYLPFLLPRLHTFFRYFFINPDTPPSAHEGWFSFEGIPLKWHYPLGLLFDLFSGAAPSSPDAKKKMGEGWGWGGGGGGVRPWLLVLHYTEWPDEQLVRLDGEGKVLHDAFINSVKEADFLRNGTAKGIMALSKDDSTRMWRAVQDQNLAVFSPIAQKLLYAQGAPLRHIPLKIYLPSSSSPTSTTSSPNTAAIGHLRVVQSLVPPTASGTREAQTLGSALHLLLPALFPSRRTPIFAKPVLHGAVVPMGAPVEELLRVAAYLDGWLHMGVVMMG